ncbi:S8 family peptidase [Metabacillus arenae]|uniref:S8 family serine peptidase n=1 Tax=Metabacillus arenae TaxID=2771434 RepID=A0A926NLD8_9BACI|nr:S8 family peptidase [Metabacillus arenae]MBD1379941.1 S8 family serine peptidase [Metabacillus arenae]
MISLRKTMYLIFNFTLVFSLFFPGMVSGQINSNSVSLKEQVSETKSLKSKITQSLYNQYKKEEKVTFLIKLKDQVNSVEVAKKAAEKAKQKKALSLQTELEKRSAIVSALRSKAAETQANLKVFLEKQQKDGKVEDIQSFYIVNGMAVTAGKTIMEQIAAFPEVEKVLPNETRELHAGVENVKVDVKSTANKAMKTKASTNSIEWNIDRVGAPSVWEMGIDGTGTVVASIDTGVQWDHPALKEKYRGYHSGNPEQLNHEFNWFDATVGEAAPYDDNGHGTHVTGTMVGSEPDGSNQIGVAPGAKWIAVKAFSENGGTDVDILEAGEWILAPKDAEGNPHPEMAPDVVNNSWGGGPGLDEWYREMVQTWRAADIFPEFSAGNTTLTNPGGPESVANPANYPESFATGATDINNLLASFSLQGPSPYDEVKPEISAPGVNIRSAVPGSNYEGGWNGTSMAGPHVSAIAALLRQVDASLTVDEIEEILLATATPLTDSTFPESPNNGYGHGLVNAHDAVASLLTGLGKVKGQVAKEGEDLDAPTFKHQAPEETFFGLNLPLSIEVQDNISVINVTLAFHTGDGNWETIEAVRSEGDFKSGVYEAVIPGDAVSGEQLTYKWAIDDFGANSVESETYQVAVLPGISVGYEQDFESHPTGWNSNGTKNVWEWGIPTTGPGNAVSGEKVYATNIDGNYQSSANMNLLMPPIDLPENSSAYLQFKQWHELENNYDFGHVFVSTDQENWTQLLRVNGTTSGWIDGEIDLSEYAGERIYISFNVTTDGSVVKQGWYLDDVKLSNEAIGSTNKAQLGITKQEKAKASVKSKKEKVNPDKMKPFKQLVITKEQIDHDAKPAILPMKAQVSVLETGKSTYSSLQDGSYELTHGAGDYTLQAEAYGYRSLTKPVTVERDGVTEANFILEELPKGQVSGVVTSLATSEPVSGATIYLVEDAAITPVKTNENGEYSLNAYEGTYTLKIIAPSFYSQEATIEVRDETTVQNFELKPYIGYPGEIGYDDGTAENARAFFDAGSGWAVKMSLAEGKERAMITSGMFRFWNTEWPVPGGTDFQVAIYDTSGTDDAPGKKLAGPFDATALRNGEWTEVDLSEHGIMVDGDFYMVYFQSAPNPNAPGLGTDEDGENAGRSWQFTGGMWSPSAEEEGNYMIRAGVNYEVTAPEITSPKDGSYTSEERITIEGNSAPTTQVHIYNGKKEAAFAETTEDGTFSSEVTLQNGENILTAKASTGAGMTDASEAVKVTLDQSKPKLTIDSPKNGDKLNSEAATVEGTVQDENLAWVKVNGKKAKIENGEYSRRILLENGTNVIKVVAQDKAGNRVNKKVTIDVNFEAPILENVKPTEDHYLKSGESVKIEFDSAPGLDATFIIRMPLTNAKASIQNANELPMREASPGYYVGYWTAPSNLKADGAEIEVIAIDEFGHDTRETAVGKLFINVKKP